MRTCPICGGSARIACAAKDVRVGKRTVVVEDEFLLCEDCGEEFVEPEMMDRTAQRAAERIRQEDGLLTPGEIRAIRDKYGLSQEAFQRLINAGPKTVTRWERGTVSQNGTADTLLRAIREFPELVRFLARERGVELPQKEGSDPFRDVPGWGDMGKVTTAPIPRPGVRIAAERLHGFPNAGTIAAVIEEYVTAPSYEPRGLHKVAQPAVFPWNRSFR